MSSSEPVSFWWLVQEYEGQTVMDFKPFRLEPQTYEQFLLKFVMSHQSYKLSSRRIRAHSF